MASKSSKHYSDASYEIYRNGYDADRLDYDKSDNDYYDGRSPEYTAQREIIAQRDERERRIIREQQDEDYYYQEQSEEQEKIKINESSTDELPF